MVHAGASNFNFPGETTSGFIEVKNWLVILLEVADDLEHYLSANCPDQFPSTILMNIVSSLLEEINALDLVYLYKFYLVYKLNATSCLKGSFLNMIVF